MMMMMMMMICLQNECGYCFLSCGFYHPTVKFYIVYIYPSIRQRYITDHGHSPLCALKRWLTLPQKGMVIPTLVGFIMHILGIPNDGGIITLHMPCFDMAHEFSCFEPNSTQNPLVN